MSDDLSIPSYQVPHRRDAESGTMRLALIAGSIVTAAAALYGGYSYFGRHHGEPPVIQADERPYRLKPENPGGMQITSAGSDVFSGDNDTAGSRLAPAPEVPDPKALRAQQPAPPPVPQAAAPQVAPLTPTAPAPVTAAPPARPGSTVARQAAPAATTAPTPAPAAKPAVVATPAPPAATAAAAPAVAAPPKPAAAPATGKSPAIQLAALSSEAAARAEWQSLQKRMPDLLGGRQPAISKTEHDGKVFWRLRTSGFQDAAQARAFCDKVRSKGSICSVAEF